MKPGAAFGEGIRTEKIRRRSYSSGRQFTAKGFLMLVILFGVVVLFVARLLYLQGVKGDSYRKLSDSNRIRTQVIYAPRGIIFDRNGIPLVLNSPGFRETVKSSKNGEEKTVFLSKEQALSQMAKGISNIAVDSLREYPFADSFAHVLGYIGQINQDQLKEKEYFNYSANDLIGKTGIEEEYEKRLKGKDGKKLIEVDAMGKEVRSLGQTDPIAGNDITLTMDSNLQEVVYSAAREIKKGAIVVSKPDGEILAMVSRPSYDPNLFTQNETYRVASDSAYKNVTAILTDSESQPLLDRAISGTYPPGSTFKLIVAAAGLTQKIIDASYHIVDTGILKVGDFSFANWFYTEYGRTEQGDVDVVRAIARSNDIFFYKLAELINVDRLSNMVNKFGLGKALGIDLPGEEAGTAPSREWKKKNIGEDWYLGDTYHYGIGQGYLLTTPLQVNAWTQVIANGGILYKPSLLKESEPEILNKNILSKESIALIKEGMIESCEPGGVAYPLFEFKVENAKLKIDGKNFLRVASSSGNMRQVVVACKTGTAEHGGPTTLPHAWITLFAPAYDPEIVVTVLSEASGEGSSVAAPVAKKVLEGYFSEKK